MTEQQNQLARQWGARLDGAGAAINWVEQVRGNSRRLNSEADSLIQSLRQLRNRAGDSNKACGIKRDFYPQLWENRVTIMITWLRSNP